MEHVKIFFDDGEKVVMREGDTLSRDSDFWKLQTVKDVIMIPIARIVRVEVL